MSSPLPSPRQEPRARTAPKASSAPRGVDLRDPETLRLLQSLFYRRFSWVSNAGLDKEDVLQQIYLSILVRNHRKNPYDPARGASLASYLYLVIQSTVLNALDARRRAIRRGWVVGRAEDVALLEVGQYHPDGGEP